MRRISALILLTGLAGFACNAPQSGGTGSGASEHKAAPELVLSKVDGTGTLSLSEQKGKVVLVDLWATWCAPCISELPHLQEMAESFSPDDFLMLGVVLESGDREDVQQFAEEKGLHYALVMGEDGTKESFGPFLGYPTKYLVDRDGRVVKRYFGVVGDELQSDIQALIETGALPEKAETSAS